MNRLTAILFTILISTASAQQAGVELIVPNTTLEVGEKVQIQLKCTNIGRPDLPQVALPDGLKIKLLNSIPSQRSFLSITNGRRVQRVSYSYSLELVGLKPGRYKLGPITVEADGATHQSNTVIIMVKPPEKDTSAKGDRYLYVEVDVQPRSVYVTQEVTASLIIGIRKVNINGRNYELNLLREVIDRGSQFSIFTNAQARPSTIMLPDSQGQRHSYQLYRVTKTIRTEEIGPLTIGPVFIKANYPTALRRGFFGGHEIARSRRETARSDVITVEVLGAPYENQPDDFTGAIGRYKMTTDVKPKTLQQGQPVTLSIAIQGSPLEGLAGPDLSKHPELMSRFDFVKDELIGDSQNATKIFRRAIFPRSPGVQTIPPISWSYFNPHTRQYVTLKSPPIEIEVHPPSSGSTTISLGDDDHNPQNETSLTLVAGGISPNYINPDIVLANQDFSLKSVWGLGSVVLPPLCYLLIFFTAKHRTRLKHDVGFARRRRARKRARAQIDHALTSSTPIHQWHGLYDTVTGYITDRFNLPPGQLTPNEARRHIIEHDYDESLASQIVTFLETCDAVRYSPGAFDSLSPQQAAENIRNWISILEQNPA